MKMLELAAWIGLFSPLGGAAFAGLLGRFVPPLISYVIATLLIFLSTSANAYLWFEAAHHGIQEVIPFFPWIEIGSFKATWSVKIDTLASCMMTLVTFISGLIHVYSTTYMAQDEGRVRFISYLSLFTFFMLILVSANDLLQLFVGWEGVGLASYLLIGFWYYKESANIAAMKAFIINRVGDVGLILGIAGIYLLFGTLSYDGIFQSLSNFQGLTFTTWHFDALTIIAFLLFIGAMGKSAQIGFHVWLPDAMEGPTPVSALLHSATMVTAGIFLLIRLNPLFEMTPIVLGCITVVGLVTSIFSGTIAITQNDIKRVIAYSTCSQLGLMFLAIGISAYAGAFFHLFTHAFFKSLLFLCAGSVIHGMSEEQDIQKMGGLRKKMPFTHALMLIGTLSLIGTPFFSGAVSKDVIMEAAWGSGALGSWIYAGGVVAIFLTAAYSWRLMILTFYGPPRMTTQAYEHIHESPYAMLWPLSLLALASIGVGALMRSSFITDMPMFWWHTLTLSPMEHALQIAEHQHWIHYLIWSIVGCVTFMSFRSFLFARGFHERLACTWPRLYKLFFHKWYVDELYQKIFIQPALRTGAFLWKKGDGAVIDRLGPDGVALSAQFLSRYLRRIQTGRVYHYALVIFIFFALLILFWSFLEGSL